MDDVRKPTTHEETAAETWRRENQDTVLAWTQWDEENPLLTDPISLP